MTAPGFFLVGLAAGSTQSLLIVFAARGFSGTLGFGARILLVAAALVFAARDGHLVDGVLGWATGFITTCVMLRRSLG